MQTSTASARATETLTRIRMSGVERRQQFIAAALRLFSSTGFKGTSTRAIADAAGASEALLFRHFPSKADLYAAILQQKAHESGFATKFDMLRRLAERGDDSAFVQYLVRAILASYQRDPEFERLMLYAALEGHELATTSRQLFGMPSFALLRDYVVKRQAAGAFRVGDPALLVFGLVALPAYFSMAHRLLGMHLAESSDRTAAELFTRLVLDGVRTHVDDLPAQVKGGRRAAAPRGGRKPRTHRAGPSAARS
jgi:TetR/AcrR family transcriptional regulator